MNAQRENDQPAADDPERKVLELARRAAKECQAKKADAQPAHEQPPERAVRNVNMGMASDIVQSSLAHLPGIKRFGRNNLFEFLRDKEILHRRGDLWNVAKWKYIQAELFDTAYVKRVEQGQTLYKLTTFVTPRGLSFIADMIETELLAKQVDKSPDTDTPEHKEQPALPPDPSATTNQNERSAKW